MKKKLGLLLVLTFTFMALMSTRAAADNWGAFDGTISTEDAVAAGKEVCFTVTVNNTTDVDSDASVYTWYYREAGNSETYPGVPFGTVAGDGYTPGDAGTLGGKLHIPAKGSCTLTVTGTMPDTWNKKSQILLVFSNSDQGLFGQIEYTGEMSSDSAGTDTGAADQPAVTIAKKPTSVKVTAAENKATVTWKKIGNTKKGKALLKQIDSIELQYATDKSFETDVVTKSLAKKKVKVTLKLEKGTRYYIRLRYVGSDGVSAWSTTKKIKIQ